MQEGYWDNSMYVEVTFDQTIPSTITVHAGNADVSGNKVIIHINNISPAYDGDYSWNFIQLSGSGAENFKIESIVIKHN